MFSAMLTDTFQDGDNSIPIRYRFDGKLFNLRRLQAKSKVQTEVLDEFLFADDMTKGAPTEEEMQKDVDQVSDSYDSYYFTISIKKILKFGKNDRCKNDRSCLFIYLFIHSFIYSLCFV